MEPAVLSEELEDGRLGEGDADDALERHDFVDHFMLFQFGRHTSSEPDNAKDANGCGYGFDDAKTGGFPRELVLEWTHDASGNPHRKVQGELDRKDLEDHDPHQLRFKVSCGREKGGEDHSDLALTLNQRKLPLSCLGLFFKTP